MDRHEQRRDGGQERRNLKLDESEIQGFDIQRSRELLEQAGWTDTNSDGTVDKNGET